MPTPSNVASAYAQVSTALSGSFNLNCGSGANRAVFVTFAGYGASNIVSSITVGGISATLVKFFAGGGDGFLATYVVLSPPTGVQAVSYTFSAASFYGTIGADSWSNVNQSTPTGTVVTTSSSSNAAPSATVAGTTAGNVVRADAWLNYAAWGYTAGQTGLWINITNQVRMGGAEYTAAGGSKTMTWTGDATANIVNAFEILASVDPPANTVAPAVTGTAQVGQTLTTTTGTWTGPPSSYAYQWKRADDSGFTTNVTNIGTDQNTFILTASESGKYVRCVVTATNAAGSTAANSNVTSQVLPAAPANTVAPSCAPSSGTVADTLTFSPGTWTGSPTSYETSVSVDGGAYSVIDTSAGGNPSKTGTQLGGPGSIATRVRAENAGGWSDYVAGTTLTVTSGGARPTNLTPPTVTPESGTPATSFAFNAGTWTGTSGYPITYTWFYRKGGSQTWLSLSTSQNPIISGTVFPASATYDTQVTATNAFGSTTINGPSVNIGTTKPAAVNPFGYFGL